MWAVVRQFHVANALKLAGVAMSALSVARRDGCAKTGKSWSC